MPAAFFVCDSPTAGRRLSGFLTGITVADPVSGVTRYFNDLLDRQGKLDEAANLSCTSNFELPLEDLFFERTTFIH